MCNACANVPRMPKMIQIRNVPDHVHRRVRIKAAEQGLTLSEYLLRIVDRDSSRPSVAELAERIRSRGRVELPPGAVERALREGREERP